MPDSESLRVQTAFALLPCFAVVRRKVFVYFYCAIVYFDGEVASTADYRLTTTTTTTTTTTSTTGTTTTTSV